MAVFYPTKIRATGVGWALGAGRVGGTLGPASGGLLLSWHFSPAAICQLMVLAAIVGACAVALIGVFYPAHRRSVASTASSQPQLPEVAAVGGTR
jgi:AAHS family 4-hydroxybenzoate transporter-like MFS transporter